MQQSRLQKITSELKSLTAENITKVTSCENIKFINYPEVTLFRSGKYIRWIKITAVFLLIWTAYCFIDCGFLESDEKLEYRERMLSDGNSGGAVVNQSADNDAIELT